MTSHFLLRKMGAVRWVRSGPGRTPTHHVSGQPLLDVLHEAGLGDGDLEGKQESGAGRGSALGNKAQDPTSSGATGWVAWGSHHPETSHF